MNRWITPAVIHKSMGRQGGSLGWVAGVGRGGGSLGLPFLLSKVKGGSAARDPPGTDTHTDRQTHREIPNQDPQIHHAQESNTPLGPPLALMSPVPIQRS